MESSQRRYSSTHEWVLLEGDVAIVGVSEFAVQQLGDVVYLDLPACGRQLRAGDALGDIESVKAVSRLYAPVSGEILETNNDLETAPETVNQSPLSEGWIVKIRATDPSELEKLMTIEEYERHIADHE